MKEKQLNFGNIIDVLSRDEMRLIVAGYGKSCTSCYKNGVSYSCTYSSAHGADACTCSVSGNDGTGCKVTS